jgi:hypothetical protein
MRFWLNNHHVRATELNQMAWIQWKRTSKSRFDQLRITLETPEHKRSRFVVTREGHPAFRQVLAKPRHVQKYIQAFYTNLSINGSGAPNDVFLDSLNKAT